MDLATLEAMNARVSQQSQFVGLLRDAIRRNVIGQDHLVDRVLIALLADGHILLEGVPGLAKTLLIKTMAQAIQADFSRIQFTPDLLPADLVGTQIYNPRTNEFRVHKGPIFASIVLADEVNRAPAKVQSALLEAMQERQVTIGDATHKLDPLFLVLATQNPIEQEGTYPLPEAQVDRFMLKVLVGYPSRPEERQIIDLAAGGEMPVVSPVVSPQTILEARQSVRQIYVDDKVKDYVLDLVAATRRPADYGLPQLAPLIAFGASPRAGIYLVQSARARAFLSGRAYVAPEDVKDLAPDILRHRVIPSFEAEAEELTTCREPRSSAPRIGHPIHARRIPAPLCHDRPPMIARFLGRLRPRRQAPEPPELQGPVSAELLRQVRRIEIKTRHLVAESFAGAYHAVFKGQGMSFEEVRPYLPGDEVRSIDWNVTARTGEPHVKRFIEERELTVMLLVDLSGSLDFGSRGRFKQALAAELAAVLAFAATSNQDRVGLLAFSDRIECIIPPRRGRRHVLRIVRDLLALRPAGKGTDLALALDTLRHLLHRRAVVFLISDFQGAARPALISRALRAATRRHDLIAVQLSDPLDQQLPPSGLLWLEDAESGERRLVDTGDAAWRTAQAAQAEAQAAADTQALREAAIDRLTTRTDQDYAPALTAFFHRRALRLRRGR